MKKTNIFEFFYYDGKAYRFNLDKINEYVFASQKERNTESEIVEVYAADPESSNKMALSNKSIRDVKTMGNIQIDNFKYDFIRMCFDIMADTDATTMDGVSNFSVGFTVAMNTMLTYGFLEEVDEDEL